MATKENVLKLLEKQKGVFFSGEEIAKECNVSRTAVWKTIKRLQQEGYKITAIPNKGYALSEISDVLSEKGIKKYLHANVELHVESVVTSTNTLVVQQALQHQKEGYVLIAGQQTKGKGRTGHSFYSPNQTGIYLSILLRPTQLTPMEATNITSMAAVSACEAIEKFGLHPKIKWINDIFIDEKKVSGILTEASISMESKRMEYVVLGIGFNVYAPENGFPEDIQFIAGAIFNEKVEDGRNRLTAYFLNSFMKYYQKWNKEEYYQSYKDHSMILNKEIFIVTPTGNKYVYAKDIDTNFELVVEDQGETKILSSGEVHIKV